ncbi:hypothetical protein BDP81DRAFT_12122 [Colletotrichum phormii]|uniref:Uncharacterized protein n=1 Tax=Colletotrichum phormii TaxID=359342 RepID=A0AAJ0ELU2_9PEZI|nr:uncharacterized protein BDP81DRAFT_12122 [Colletotrichum phormii]KAK1655907.1 hypothetical protein BDP81DRAFT_12122 [Colletotrichum phormii]
MRLVGEFVLSPPTPTDTSISHQHESHEHRIGTSKSYTGARRDICLPAYLPTCIQARGIPTARYFAFRLSTICTILARPTKQSYCKSPKTTKTKRSRLSTAPDPFPTGPRFPPTRRCRPSHSMSWYMTGMHETPNQTAPATAHSLPRKMHGTAFGPSMVQLFQSFRRVSACVLVLCVW